MLTMEHLCAGLCVFVAAYGCYVSRFRDDRWYAQEQEKAAAKTKRQCETFQSAYECGYVQGQIAMRRVEETIVQTEIQSAVECMDYRDLEEFRRTLIHASTMVPHAVIHSTSLEAVQFLGQVNQHIASVAYAACDEVEKRKESAAALVA